MPVVPPPLPLRNLPRVRAVGVGAVGLEPPPPRLRHVQFSLRPRPYVPIFCAVTHPAAVPSDHYPDLVFLPHYSMLSLVARPASLVCLATAALLAAPVHAQTGIRLIASDGMADDFFGSSIAVDGGLAIIGAHGVDDNGNRSGAAYVFHRSGSSWVEEAKLIASDGAAGDDFGQSVDLDGDYAVVGAFRDDDSGDYTGSAYVFHRSGTTWTQEAKLAASDGAAGDYFGTSIAVKGDYAIVGAHGSGDFTGAAYVFRRSGSSWVEEAKLVASDGEESDDFGISVDIDGDYAIIGAHTADGKSDLTGAAYVFRRSGSSWVEEAKLAASDGAESAYFGQSVDLDGGGYAAIGAPNDSNDNGDFSGSAYVFRRSGSSWVEEAKLTATDGGTVDRFGSSVAINGDYIVVGADGAEFDTGSAYVFRRSGSSWVEEAKLVDSDGADSDWFGTSVTIDGGHAFVGAPGTDAGGLVFVFDLAAVVSVEGGATFKPFTISETYPNPSQGYIQVAYEVSKATGMRVAVYDVLGREVAVLHNGPLAAGAHRLTFDGSALPAGVYVLRATGGGLDLARRVTLVR